MSIKLKWFSKWLKRGNPPANQNKDDVIMGLIMGLIIVKFGKLCTSIVDQSEFSGIF